MAGEGSKLIYYAKGGRGNLVVFTIVKGPLTNELDGVLENNEVLNI